MATESFASPLGTLYFDVSDKGLRTLSFRKPATGEKSEGNRKLSAEVRRALTRYFRGDTDALRRVPLDVAGTAFQQKVWRAARRIRPGSAASYGELAQRIGHDGAGRAVGTALGKNPVLLAVPCHRVIAADGSLGGFTGGLHKKRFLLQHEASRA